MSDEKNSDVPVEEENTEPKKSNIASVIDKYIVSLFTRMSLGLGDTNGEVTIRIILEIVRNKDLRSFNSSITQVLALTEDKQDGTWSDVTGILRLETPAAHELRRISREFVQNEFFKEENPEPTAQES